jgi:hypothetical protein
MLTTTRQVNGQGRDAVGALRKFEEVLEVYM